MTKRLILIRHAKSSWEAPFDDHARTLNKRGRAAAAAIGGWLKDKGYVPDTIYCSDAARTRETTDTIVGALGAVPKIILKDTMYHADPATLLGIVQQAEGNTVALVAHNPGIAFFAEQIVARPPESSRFFDYPTGATLICDISTNNWAEAVPRSGQVVDFIIPKNLGC